MHRKSDKKSRRKYMVFLVLSITSVLFGLLILLIPLIPSPPYEAYSKKEIIISEFEEFHGDGRYLSSYDYIVTEDGETYNITGDYNKKELSKILTEGTHVTIKCRTNRVFPFLKYAEEMVVDGEKIVTYNNDEPTDWAIPIVLCLLFVLLGGMFFMGSWSIRKKQRNLQAKRDARIIKKYGELNK